MDSTFYHSYRPFLPRSGVRDQTYAGYTTREVRYYAGTAHHDWCDPDEERVIAESQFPPEVYTAAESYFGLSMREELTVAHVFAYQRAMLFADSRWPCDCLRGGVWNGVGEHVRAQDIRKDG